MHSLSSRLNKLKLIFYKKQKVAFEPPFGGLRGNACTPSIACGKVRGCVPICHNLTFFVISYS